MSAKYTLSFLLLFFILAASGQEAKTPEKVVIGDTRFILHKVQKKETLYSISKRYDCTQEEVLANNKDITGIIKKGMVLKVPDHTYQKPQKPNSDESKFLRHVVISGDNFYQLKLKYGIEEEELLKVNPALKDGLKAGMTLLIPKKSKEEAAPNELQAKESPSNVTPFLNKVKGSDKTFNVGLYLPISGAVADSLKPSARTLSFLAYYQGALMAVDQLSKAGLKAKLYVYDTEKLASSVEALVKKPEFLSLDLIIGPVYPQMQKIVSELSAKNRIPMVSPLSPEDSYTKVNPYYFQINPIRKLRLEATADYIFKEFSKEKIIFLEAGNGSSETKSIHDQLGKKISPDGTGKTKLQSYNIWAQGIEGLEAQLQADKPNILVMAEKDEVNVSIAMNRLALLAKKYPFILVGVQEFTRMPSIETENLHDVNMRFLSTSFVDYGHPSVITFVESFKTEFGTEPSLFAFQGYDVTTFFLQSLNGTGNLTKGLPADSNKGLLQSVFHFSKVSDFGGYTNDSFTVVEYSSTFDVKMLGRTTNN
jgi:LysM repeat protein/ABC-type branched-subunit amino acid transport system substrate-binding protein